jgi:Spy/CpxP family protein refolding chaperone
MPHAGNLQIRTESTSRTKIHSTAKAGGRKVTQGLCETLRHSDLAVKLFIQSPTLFKPLTASCKRILLMHRLILYKTQNMKKLVTMFAGMLLLVFAVAAQDLDKSKSKHKGKHHTKTFMKELNLSDAQRAELKKINTDFKTKMSDLKKNENITVGEQKEKKATLVKEHKEAFDKVLTAEQKDKLAELRKERMEGRKEFAAKRAEKMKSQVNLTDEQTAKIKSLQDDYKSKMTTLRTDESKTKDQKKEELTKLRKQYREDLNNVLTAEQKEKMKTQHSRKGMKERTR